jgi:sugar lactone lactonase YvrE
MLVFASSGRLLRQLDVADSSPLLLGLAFHRVTGALLVVDFGGKAVRQVDPVTGASSVFAVIPADAAAGPNALAFDRAGNVYLSDSFQGAIWRAGPQDGRPTAWVRDALLTIAGVPPFGANGLAFNRAETARHRQHRQRHRRPHTRRVGTPGRRRCSPTASMAPTA